MGDTTVHPLGILSNANLFERAGERGFLADLGVTRGQLLEGERVPWDRYAGAFERVVDAVGLTRLVRVAAETADAHPQAAPVFGGVSSQREALERFCTTMAPMLWPGLQLTPSDLGAGLLAIETHIPAPLVVPRGLAEANGSGYACVPRDAGLRSCRLLDLHVSEGGRRARHVFELEDELVREPIGPLGDAVAGPLILMTVDAVEAAGFDPTDWFREIGVDRAGMMAGAWVPWDACMRLFAAVEHTLGLARFHDAMLQFAELARGLRPILSPAPDLVSLYRHLHVESSTRLWGAFGTPAIDLLRPGVLRIRLPLRAGLEGRAALFHAHAAVVESIPGHLGLPNARVDVHVDDDAGGATYVAHLPAEQRPRASLEGAGRGEGPVGPAASDMAEAVLSSRRATRVAVVERVGHALVDKTDVHAIADVVLEAAVSTLGGLGASVELATGPEGALVPLRMRGKTEADPLARALMHGGARVGELRIWTAPEHTGDVLAALDLLEPWLAIAFGTALLHARERRARLEADERGAAAARLLAGVLEAHPWAAYVITDDGRVVGGNARARTELASDGVGVPARLARAAGDPAQTAFDVFPVVVEGRTERVVLVERERGVTIADRVRDAAGRWSLTTRQAEVLELVARGLSNKEIGLALGCSEVTVEKHVTSIFRAAGVDARGRLVAAVVEPG